MPLRYVMAFLAGLALLGCARTRANVYSGFVDSPLAAVAAPVSGQVAEVAVREGERVSRGQLLAKLDPRERAALVAQAEANLERAKQALHEAGHNAEAIAPTVRAAQADVLRQRAELDDASLEFERIERLVKSGAASPSQVDSARARLAAARAAVASLGASGEATRGRVNAALASVEAARAAVQSSQAALELARIQLAQTEIRSPFDGLVAEQSLQEGEWAAPGTPVVTVEDGSRQWVRIDVEEDATGALKIGDKAEVRVIAFGDKHYLARVIEIGAEGEFAINRDVKRGRPDLRTFRVRVALDKPAKELRPGMTAEVTLPEEPPR